MNAAARSSAFCGIVGGGGDMVRVAASLRWGSSARRLRGRRRSRLDVFCLRSLAYEETLVVHSGLRKRRTGSEDADRRHLRKTSPRLRPLSPRTPARRDLDHRIQRDRQLRRSRSPRIRYYGSSSSRPSGDWRAIIHSRAPGALYVRNAGQTRPTLVEDGHRGPEASHVGTGLAAYALYAKG